MFCLFVIFKFFFFVVCLFVLIVYMLVFFVLFYYSPNSACARGSGGIVCFDRPLPPPAVANFCVPSVSRCVPRLFLMKSNSGLCCVSGAEVGPQVLFEMQTCAAMDLCARRRAASRTGRQSSHIELALSWSSVVPKKCSFGKLVWVASVGLQFVCQLNSQAELAHGTCAPVVFCVPPKNIFRWTCLVGFSWPPICLPAELAGRSRTQNLRSRCLPCCLPKKLFRRTCLVGLSWPPIRLRI